MAAVIPVVGELGKSGKYGIKAIKAYDKGGDIAKTLTAVRKPLAKNEGKQFKATAKGIKKASKGKADKAAEVVKGGTGTFRYKEVKTFTAEQTNGLLIM